MFKNIIKRKKIENHGYKTGLLTIIISTGIFIGFIPAASGTFATVFGLLFFLIPAFNNYFVLAMSFIIIFLAGIITSQQMMKRYGDDPSVVVVDEIAGIWFSVLIVKSFLQFDFTFVSFTIMFFIFRFFDIYKIFPANYFDKIKNGYGIMMDDVSAGFNSGIAFIILKIFLDIFNLKIL